MGAVPHSGAAPQGAASKKSKRSGPRPKHIPQRMCVACRDHAAKRALIRLVRTPEGNVEVDPTGKKRPRGLSLRESRVLGKGVEDRPPKPRPQHIPVAGDDCIPAAACGHATTTGTGEGRGCPRGVLMTNTYQGGTRRGGSTGRSGPGGGGGNGRGGRGGRGRSGGRSGGARTVAMKRVMPVERAPVALPPVMSVAELADILQTTGIEIIKELMKIGIMASINQQIDFDTAERVAISFGWEINRDGPDELAKAEADFEAGSWTRSTTRTQLPGRRSSRSWDTSTTARPSCWTAIRSANVAEGEAGGITQHIGAYQIEAQGRKISFLDTPGHEAFTAMRARGAQATDIAVLVVAADDGVMPTTKEAIAHIRSANVPLVVAINKIDLPAANPDRVKQQLSENLVMPEEWGGDVAFVEVSAREKLGLDDLLEVILLVADVNELKANPHKPATGVVVEAKVDRIRGPVATHAGAERHAQSRGMWSSPARPGDGSRRCSTTAASGCAGRTRACRWRSLDCLKSRRPAIRSRSSKTRRSPVSSRNSAPPSAASRT